MEMDIYQKLADYLDNLPGGFAASETGVEIRLQKTVRARRGPIINTSDVGTRGSQYDMVYVYQPAQRTP